MNQNITNFLNERKMNNIGESKIKLDMAVLTQLETFLNKDFRDASREDIINFLNSLDVKDSSKAMYKASLKIFYNWLFDMEKGEYPDCVKHLKTTFDKHILTANEILTETEVNSLIDNCDNLRDKALISLLYESAGRISEILTLRWKDLDFFRDFVRVNIQESKTYQRTVPVSECKEYLKLWKAETKFNQPEDFIFSTFGKGINQRAHIKPLSANLILRHAGKLAGIDKKLHCHILRHSKLTHLTCKNVNAEVLKKIAGWSGSSNMANTYIHLNNKDVENAILSVNGLATEETREINLIKPITCKCGNLCSHEDYCSKCGNALTEKAIETVNVQAETMKERLDRMEKTISQITTALLMNTSTSLKPKQVEFNKKLAQEMARIGVKSFIEKA